MTITITRHGRFRWQVAILVGLGLCAAVTAGTFVLLQHGNWTDSPERTPVLVVRAGGSDTCPMSKQGAETAGDNVAVEVALPVLRSGSSALSRYLKKLATQTSSDIEIGAAGTQLYRISKSADQTKIADYLKCIVIAHATTGKLDASALPPRLLDRSYLAEVDPDQLFVRRYSDRVNTDTLRSLQFDDIPLSYFEFSVEKDDTGTAMRLAPSFVYFREPITKLGKSAPKNIEITFTISWPTSTGYLGVTQDSSKLLAQIPASFASLRPSPSLHVNDQNFQTVWVSALPKPPDLAAERPLIDQMAKDGIAAIAISPANLIVSYRESDDPLLWLQFASDMLGELGSEKK
jgi:hypothetical protein